MDLKTLFLPKKDPTWQVSSYQGSILDFEKHLASVLGSLLTGFGLCTALASFSNPLLFHVVFGLNNTSVCTIFIKFDVLQDEFLTIY